MTTQALVEQDCRKAGGRQSEPLPFNGPAAAVVVSAGIGCATLGLATVLVEASPKVITKLLNFYNPVGPLSGKTIVAIVAFFISWIVLGLRLDGKEVRLARWATAGFVLIALGFLLTFPPVFDLFAAK